MSVITSKENFLGSKKNFGEYDQDYTLQRNHDDDVLSNNNNNNNNNNNDDVHNKNLINKISQYQDNNDVNIQNESTLINHD